MTPTFATRCSLAIALAALCTAAPAATTDVDFVKPEGFTDAGRGYSPGERDNNLEMLKKHLVSQAARMLPGDQKLSVTVTDVDLAGSFEPRQRISNEVRIVRDMYPPRIDLSFRLVAADGSLVKEGTRNLRDPAFMMGTLRYKGDSLGYEKALLDEWLEREFLRPSR